jgi:hypothetical protein
MIHEFEKKIDNGRDPLSRVSIAFQKREAGEIRSGQMLRWIDVMVKQEQYKDLLREAEKRAFVKQALLERERRPPLGGRILATLMRYAINLRCAWLEGYASVFKVSVQTPCQEASTKETL